MSERNQRGRAYQCIRCKDSGHTYINEKRRMVSHILKVHLSLDQVPCYCRVCHFRCLGEGDLKAHLHTYGEHRRKVQQLRVEGRMMDEKQMLCVNQEPYLIGEADMLMHTKADSDKFFLSKRQETPRCDMLEKAALEAGIDRQSPEVENILSSLLDLEGPIVTVPVSTQTPVETATAPSLKAPVPVLSAPVEATSIPAFSPVGPTVTASTTQSDSDSDSDSDDFCDKLVPVITTLQKTMATTAKMLKSAEQRNVDSIDKLTEAMKEQTAAINTMATSISELVTELRESRKSKDKEEANKENRGSYHRHHNHRHRSKRPRVDSYRH